MYTVPAFTALLAVIFLRERMGSPGWTGLMISLTGTFILACSTGHAIKFEMGILALLTAALSLAAFFVIQRPLVQRYGALPITAYGVWISGILLAPFLPLTGVVHAPTSAILAAVYLGAFPTVIAYTLWAYALARMPVARGVSCLYFVPAVATILGFVALNERPTLLAVVGGVIAIGGVAIVNLRGTVQIKRTKTKN